MSTPTKARGKRGIRALPNIPVNRAATSVDRIVTTTPKSSPTISKRTDFNSACVDVIKNRNCTSQQPKNGPIMNLKVPSELCSRRKDLSSSESGSNTSSPFGSPRATRKATVGPMVAEIIDKFSTGSHETTSVEENDVKEETVSTEKKIARVLPMTPQFIEEHLIADDEPSSTKHNEETSLIINKLQAALGLNNNFDAVKGSLTPKNSEIKIAPGVLQAKLAGTPSISTTPQQPFPADDGEGSSIRVGVRVRPLLPR